MFPFKVNFSNRYSTNSCLSQMYTPLSRLSACNTRQSALGSWHFSSLLTWILWCLLELLNKTISYVLLGQTFCVGYGPSRYTIFPTAFWGCRISTSSPTSKCHSLAFLSCVASSFACTLTHFPFASLHICSMLPTKSTRYPSYTIVDLVHCPLIEARGVLIFLPNLSSAGVNPMALQGVLQYSPSINGSAKFH